MAASELARSLCVRAEGSRSVGEKMDLRTPRCR
jgi:hypothetical protein